MGIPQLILSGWYVLGLGVSLAYHGKSNEGKCSFWRALVKTAIIFALLACGGFYK